MDMATKISDNIFLGPLSVARKQDSPKELGITAVVCAAAEGRSFFPGTFDYYEASQLVEHTIIGILDDVWKFVEPKLLNRNTASLATSIPFSST